MDKQNSNKSKFAPSSYRYEEKKPTLKMIIWGLVIISFSGILASYTQRGVDLNRSEPSIFGLVVLIIVWCLSAYSMEKIVRGYFFNKS